MTSLTPDLPDWTRQDSAGTVFVDGGPLAAGTAQIFGLVGVASYIIVAVAPAGGDLRLLTTYRVAPQYTLPIMTAALTALSPGNQPLPLTYETPSYGGVAEILNNGPDDITLTVLSSNRPVATPRILGDLVTPQQFYYFGTPLVAATPVTLAPAGGFTPGYVANFDASFTITSTVTGALSFAFIDAYGDSFSLPLGEAIVGTVSLPAVPLPQCVGQLVFTPDIDDPAPNIVVIGVSSHT